MRPRRARKHLTSSTFMAAVSDGLGFAFSATEAPEQDRDSRSGRVKYALVAVAFVWSTASVRGGILSGDSYWPLILLTAVLCGIIHVVDALAQQGGPKVLSLEIRGNKKIELPAIAGRLTL